MEARSRTARPHVEAARIGMLTQGTVFNCATAFRYPKKEVFGLTITARCDVAQEKYRLLNYVPIVRLHDWLQVDGLEILLDQERKQQLGGIKSALIEADLSPNLILSVPLSSIISVSFGAENRDRKATKIRERLEKIASEMEAVEKSKANPRACLSWLTENRLKSIRQLVKELFEHKVMGYYFLERLYPNAEAEGFVCLLREGSSLPKEIAEELANGLSTERWGELAHQGVQGHFEFLDLDLAGPVTQLGSPTIEHVMQSYANLFGRIGIADPRAEDLDFVIDRLQSATEKKT